MENKARAHVIISGKVQGVFFRMETQRAANLIGHLSGWVRNKQDGTVEAVFEGDKDKVDKAIDWCHQGSPHSDVDDVIVDWQEYQDEFTGFDVKY